MTHLSVCIILLALLISVNVVNHSATHRNSELCESGCKSWINDL
jgi:hypothetical protein